MMFVDAMTETAETAVKVLLWHFLIMKSPSAEHEKKHKTRARGCREGDIDPVRMFFDCQDAGSPRLLNNGMLFDAVKTVPTDFMLDKRYAWLLRYNARWDVAHRIWSLCKGNRPLLDTLGPGKARQVCDEPLPPRAVDDNFRALNDDVGSAEWIRVGL